MTEQAWKKIFITYFALAAIVVLSALATSLVYLHEAKRPMPLPSAFAPAYAYFCYAVLGGGILIFLRSVIKSRPE